MNLDAWNLEINELSSLVTRPGATEAFRRAGQLQHHAQSVLRDLERTLDFVRTSGGDVQRLEQRIAEYRDRLSDLDALIAVKRELLAGMKPGTLEEILKQPLPELTTHSVWL